MPPEGSKERGCAVDGHIDAIEVHSSGEDTGFQEAGEVEDGEDDSVEDEIGIEVQQRARGCAMIVEHERQTLRFSAASAKTTS